MNVFGILAERGFDTVPASFYGQVKKWQSWYDGYVKDFHTYHVFNGQHRVECTRYSAGMPKKVCEDMANLLMNEKVSITLEGEAEQKFVDAVLQANNFWVKVNEMQELKSCSGTTAYIPRVMGAVINAESGEMLGKADEIKMDYCTAEHIYPLSCENGHVTECAFTSDKVVDGKTYLYMQIHRKENGLYIIENLLFESDKGGLKEVGMGTVKGFESVPPVIRTNSTERQFVLDRLNVVNNVDPSLPMGVSIFANAIDNIKGVDVAYDSYVNEFVLGKKRIMVKPEAQKDIDGNPVFDPNDTVFYVLPEDSESGSVIEAVDMTLRITEHASGLQDMLNMLSAKCGFGENHYRFNNGNISTATQIISENSTLFRTIKKHEIILEDVLVELCRIILRMGNAYMGATLDEDVEISVDFDDSIIEDESADFARDMQLLNAGIMNDWEFRAKWMNEDEDTAKKMLPRMQDMVDEGQDDVE